MLISLFAAVVVGSLVQSRLGFNQYRNPYPVYAQPSGYAPVGTYQLSYAPPVYNQHFRNLQSEYNSPSKDRENAMKLCYATYEQLGINFQDCFPAIINEEYIEDKQPKDESSGAADSGDAAEGEGGDDAAAEGDAADGDAAAE